MELPDLNTLLLAKGSRTGFALLSKTTKKPRQKCGTVILKPVAAGVKDSGPWERQNKLRPGAAQLPACREFPGHRTVRGHPGRGPQSLN